MAKKIKSISSLLNQNTDRRSGGNFLTQGIVRQISNIQKQLDPRHLARTLGGTGLMGDLAVHLTGKLIDSSGFGKRRNRTPEYSSISAGPIRPLRLGDASADILGKIYNFMRKTDEINIRKMEIDNAFRQEQMDEDERRHQELVRAIKGITGKRGTISGNGGGVGTTDPNGGDDVGFSNFITHMIEWQLGKAGIKSVIKGRLNRSFIVRSIGNRIGRIIKKMSPKKVTTALEEPIPKITKAPPKVTKSDITEPRGNRKPPPSPRGSRSTKDTLKARRVGRGMPMRETELSKSRTEKATESVKSGAKKTSSAIKTTAKAIGKGASAVTKSTVKISAKVLKGGINLLKFLKSIPGISALANAGLMYMTIDKANAAYEAGLISEHEHQRIIVEAVGGGLGAAAGGLIGADLGMILGPVGAILGGVGGSIYGGMKGEQLANFLYETFSRLSDSTAEQKLEEIKKLPGEFYSAVGDDVSGAWNGIKKAANSPSEVLSDLKSSVQEIYAGAKDTLKYVDNKLSGNSILDQKNKVVIPKSTTIPQTQPAQETSGGQPIVSVNNKVNNIGGKPSTVLSTNTANQRNGDLSRYLFNISSTV